MDEPTSGLDSFTAYNLMRTAQDIARHGRVVVMSLHQPSPDMFDSLSQVLLLAKGRLAYLGSPANVGPHFGAAGFPVPAGRQPAEHMLHVASQPDGLAALLVRAPAGSNRAGPKHGGKESGLGSSWSFRSVLSSSPRSKAASTHHLKSDSFGAASSADEEWRIGSADGQQSAEQQHAAVAAADAVATIRVHPVSVQPQSSLHPHHARHAGTAAVASTTTSAADSLSDWAAGQARQCAVLYWRAFTNMRREPRLLLLHLLVAIILGLVVGAVFFQLDGSNVGLQNRLGSMFFALALFGWTSMSVVDGLVLERELVEREVAGHYYSGSTYLLSSLVLDGLLLRTLPALLFCALVYPMVRLKFGASAGGRLHAHMLACLPSASRYQSSADSRLEINHQPSSHNPTHLFLPSSLSGRPAARGVPRGHLYVCSGHLHLHRRRAHDGADRAVPHLVGHHPGHEHHPADVSMPVCWIIVYADGDFSVHTS
jgi:hypothetical protein